MSQALTLARPYARAAFGLAKDAGAFAAWSDALGFAARVAADPQAATLLGHPALTREQAVELLSSDAASTTFRDFLALLADNRRLALLPEIAGMYEELRAEAEHVVKATVTSATALPAGELDGIKAALKKRFGRDVQLETAVDESLIGGAVIAAGDVVIDGSLRGKLSRLQTALAG
ncbi:MAG TPA: F0F1 ATP synthase subunit delta [Luteimonas sp.]|nr:F0F1 ATP synthase subunit delta [Luteimonas sp.]HRO28749.1 F0F1 ATP synthase subunit delta [Luteimonas sp.]HRP72922.1 F0F1 ATP synthase subunit delta [Luteimonas sp.]